MNTELDAHSTRLGALTLATYFVALSITAPLFGQNNPCAEPLKEGVYNHYRERTSAHKYSSMKDYFKSDEFKEEVKKGGWGGGITIPIYGVPVSANANSSHDDLTKFQRGVETLSENQLDEALAREIEKSEPNTKFTKQYFDCVAGTFGKGFSSSAEQIGRRAFITIRFLPISASDPMPVLTEDPMVDNATDISAPKKGQQLDFSTIVNAVPKDVKEPVTVTIQTSKGTYYASSAPPTPTPIPTPQPTPRRTDQRVSQSCKGNSAKCDQIWTIRASTQGQLTIGFTVSNRHSNPIRLHYLINRKERTTRDFGYSKTGDGQNATGLLSNTVDLGEVKKDDEIGLQAEILPGGSARKMHLDKWAGDVQLSISPLD